MPDAQEWPISADALRSYVRQGESSLVEFKRDWFPLDRAEGKAKLAKAVLALANTVQAGEVGLLVFGVDDESRGSRLVGVSTPPKAEMLSDILSDYVLPPPDTHYREVRVAKALLSVIGVLPSDARPHHSIREHPGILNTDTIYVRRDKIVGVATLPEVEAMIRGKAARLGPAVDREPLKCGFVSRAHVDGNRTLIARVANVTLEPLAGIDVVFDVSEFRDPSLVHRVRALTNMTLQPGESREASLPLSQVTFYRTWYNPVDPGIREITGLRDYGSKVGDRWWNALLRVYYRDADGYLHELQRNLAIDG